MNLMTKKTRSISIAMLLVLSFIVSMFACVPTANATGIPTYAFLTVSPNPVGVNQSVTIIMWIYPINPTTLGGSGGVWENYSVAITKPDGNSESLGPFRADPAAYAYATYKPDIIGTYKLKFTFPGQQVTGIGGAIPIPINDYYEPSSFATSLTVQEQPIAEVPQTGLPTDYWTRPINAQNHDWFSISGNWLGTGTGSFGLMNYNNTGNFNPYSKSPDSAHIVWTRQLEFGGLIGGEFGGTTTSAYYTGKTYEPKFTPPIIINGVIYYNVPSPPRNGFYAVDLRTGETLWSQNITGQVANLCPEAGIPTFGYGGITMGQVYNYKSPNQIGGIPYLWYIPSAMTVATGGNANWRIYDAVTGNLVLTLTNTTAGGTTVQGSNGELLIYYLSTNWLAMWNSSKCIGTVGNSGTQAWLWRPIVGSTLDWQKGVQWNVTTPLYPGQTIAQINSGIVLATTGNAVLPQNSQLEIGYNANTGAQLWVQNRTVPTGSTSWGRMGPLINGIYTEFEKETMRWRGYDAYTGKLLWGPTEPYTNAWGSMPLNALSAYGILYARSVDGIHAFNLTTGQRIWDFYAESSGFNFPGFSTYPFLGSIPTIADGKIFASTGNSHGEPLNRGASLYAINAFSGEQVWRVSGFYLGTMPVSDGYLLAENAYDNRIYCFGKGQTATTVTASPKISTNGESILIEGTVTDQSPGAIGTSAISDDDMSAWMEYLYMQQPKPTNATGVPVEIFVVDANGNYRSIGITTSDATGFYSLQWQPDIPGKYTVYAKFAGSESYYPSQATTAFAVDEPEATPTPQPAQTQSMDDRYFVPAVIGIIVTIIVVGAVVILALRKRP